MPTLTEDDVEHKEEVVESLRMMAELIIWGDQNNSSVLECAPASPRARPPPAAPPLTRARRPGRSYCLENNVLEFFLTYLKNAGKDVQTQLLQTLSIMLQNLKNNAYIYYMLSQNHLNSLITHKFDFQDEELVGLYISLVKTIALKLDAQTVQFFFNKRSNNMPLLTEVIKFYANKDRNVRISVRTITLQAFAVDEAGVQQFILERCAVPYFSNLIWFVREECNQLDREFATASTKATGTLESLAAEHLDRLFYLSDVFETAKPPIARVVCEQLLYKVLLPRAVASVVPSEQEDMLSPMMAMMFLAQTLFVFASPACSELTNAIACALLCQAEPTQRGSAYRQALFAAIEADDDRVVLASLSVLAAIFDSPVDEEILELAQLVPMRCQVKKKLRQELVGADAEQSAPATPDGEDAPEGGGAPAADKPSLPELMAMVDKGVRGLVEGEIASPPTTGLESVGSEPVAAPELEPEPEPPAAETDKSVLVEPPAVLQEGATATVDDLLERLVSVLGRHTDGLRIVVLQLSIKLILALRQHETTDCLLEPAQMDKVLAALESAGAVVVGHLDSQWAASIFVFFREELTKLEQRPLNFEHTVSDPVTMLPLDQERDPYIDLSKRLPQNEEEAVRRDIRVFLLLREFVRTLSGAGRGADDEDPLRMSLNGLFMAPRFSEQEAIDLSTTRSGPQHP